MCRSQCCSRNIRVIGRNADACFFPLSLVLIQRYCPDIGCGVTKESALLNKMIWMLVFALSSTASYGAPLEAPNLALKGTMHSWEPGAVALLGHEPNKANDASQRSYWQAGASHLPEDLGVEWKTPRTVSSLIVRYFDGRMVRGPWAARTQQWARLQYWDSATWRHINAQVLGQETAVVRYVFPPVNHDKNSPGFYRAPRPASTPCSGQDRHLYMRIRDISR